MKKKGLSKKTKSTATAQIKSNTVPVLYQNIGGEVYAFAQVGTEVYFAKIPIQAKSPKSVNLIRMVQKEAA